MHFLTEDQTRRRVRPGAATNGEYSAVAQEPYGDEGKDVYSKMSNVKVPTLGGRPRKPPPPPAQNLVRSPRW